MEKKAQPIAQPVLQPVQLVPVPVPVAVPVQPTPAPAAPNETQKALAESHLPQPGALDPYKVAEGKTGKDAVMANPNDKKSDKK